MMVMSCQGFWRCHVRIQADSFTDTVNVTVGGGGLKKSDQVSLHDSEVKLIFAMIIILLVMLQ